MTRVRHKPDCPHVGIVDVRDAGCACREGLTEHQSSEEGAEGLRAHSHDTGGAWSLTRWTVPNCTPCELDAVRFEAIGSGGLREDVVALSDARRILADRLAAVQAERERRVTENDSEFLMRTLTRHQWEVVGRKVRAEVESAEAEVTRLRAQVAEVEALADEWAKTCSERVGGRWTCKPGSRCQSCEEAATLSTRLRAVLDSPTLHAQREAEVGARALRERMEALADQFDAKGRRGSAHFGADVGDTIRLWIDRDPRADAPAAKEGDQ